MTNLVQKSICANQLSCANRLRYNWAHTRKRKRDNSQPSLMQAPTLLLHLLSLEKAQNHQLRWSRDVNSSYAHSSVLNNSTDPKQRLCVASLLKQLKPDQQRVDKLPTTHSVWIEHIRHAQVQTYIQTQILNHCHVWWQNLVVNPEVPDPVILGWQMQDGKLLSLLKKEAPVPVAGSSIHSMQLWVH